MKIRYKGETCVSLTAWKVYDVISVEDTYFRIVDETGEDYLFAPDLFDVVNENGTHRFTEQFVAFCEKNLDLTDSLNYGYNSLTVCLIDCVYSLRAKYYNVTLPIVDRYAAAYMSGDRLKNGDTVSMLLQRMDELGGPTAFADKILKNHQKLGGKNNIPKEQVCYQLAKYLSLLHIETIEDFQTFESQELLEIVIRAVRGLGDAGVNYLFMLAGDPNRCKPDVHIHHCIRDACGADVSNDECQQLFADAVAVLRAQHPGLTVRMLDGIIWKKYENAQHKNRS